MLRLFCSLISICVGSVMNSFLFKHSIISVFIIQSMEENENFFFEDASFEMSDLNSCSTVKKEGSSLFSVSALRR